MRAAIITPPKMLHMVPETRYNLVLAHLVNHVPYVSYYKSLSPRGMLFVDNGAAEGATVSNSQLANAAIKFKATDVIIPDVLGDQDKTTALVEGFKRRATINTEFRYWAVLQEQNPVKSLEVVRRYMTMSWVHGVCLPRILNTESRLNRLRILDDIDKFKDVPWVHCLGSSPWVAETKQLKHYGFVIGQDTSAPIAMAIKGLDIHYNDYTGRPGRYFTRQTVDRKLLDHNVYTFLEWANSH